MYRDVLDKAKALKNPIRQKVLEFLYEHGPANFKDIWRGIGQKPAYKNLIEHIRILEEAEFVLFKDEQSVSGNQIIVELNKTNLNLPKVEYEKKGKKAKLRDYFSFDFRFDNIFKPSGYEEEKTLLSALDTLDSDELTKLDELLVKYDDKFGKDTHDKILLFLGLKRAWFNKKVDIFIKKKKN